MDTKIIAWDVEGASDIAHIERMLAVELKELSGRIAAGRNDVETDHLLKHCRDTADSLLEAVAHLGDGPKANVLRVIAEHMIMRLATLELDYGPVAVH